MMHVCTNLLCTGAIHAINTIMYSYVQMYTIYNYSECIDTCSHTYVRTCIDMHVVDTIIQYIHMPCVVISRRALLEWQTTKVESVPKKPSLPAHLN